MTEASFRTSTCWTPEGKARTMPAMRALFVCLAVLVSATVAEALGDSSDSSKGNADIVATYDAILATIEPDQATVAFGDMIVQVETLRLWRDQFAGIATPNSASATGINKWTGGNVYYAFNANVSAAHQAAFVDAAREWESFANLHFILRTSQTNYIMVNDGGSGLSGGNSALGMIGGQQQLNIGASSWNRGTLLHEIGHALGLIHEHQRSDRDTFVTINFSNVPGGAGNGDFSLTPTSTNNGAYDFLSIMHYSRKAFAVNTAIDTITPKAGYTQFIDVMGNNPDRQLSRADRDGIAAMYGAGPALSTVVTNTQDSGPGSLRAAIYKAFDTVTDTPAATPTITFQIPNTDPGFSGGVFTIKPSDRMTAPGNSTTIDATTQTTFGGDTNPSGPEVVLNGVLQNDPSTFGLGFRLSGANVTIKGFVINGFSTQGILIIGAGATGNTVSGCYIGTNAAGTAAVANAFAGIEIKDGATNNVIGGTTTAERNVISGNTAQGAFIRGTGTTGNSVRGNYLGLNAAGTGAVPNGFSGTEIAENASNNTIGGNIAGAGNVLSGNTYQGVYLTGVSNNLVAGNLIGTNPAGTSAVANGGAGVQISNASQGNTVGGTTSAARNILSGNTYQGVAINGAGTSNNAITGNYIGINASGTGAISNASGGVVIFGAASNNTIGGTTAGAGNVLSGNNAQGVTITDAGTTGNVVAGNFIGTNPSGTAAIANAYSGVGIFSAATNNTIGGTASGAGNLISGNTNQGIYIANAGTNGNVVLGNLVGTNATATGAIANGYAGVEIGGGAQNNIVGGNSLAARNLLSGNNSQGVAIQGAGTSGNVIAGNYIGTNPAGTAAIPNNWSGVAIFNGATGNTVGGTAPGAGNLLSGNGNQGVFIVDAGTTGNKVHGNLIGTNVAGTASLPNGFPGIEIYNGASANFIGGAAPGEGNVISGNGFRNVSLVTCHGNFIAGNLIGLNAAGTGAVSNAGPGVQIYGGSQNNVIGGTSGGRNFIAGNTGSGITISGINTTGNLVIGNSIGRTPAGAAVANTGEGIAVFADGSGSPQNNTIGGSTPGAANWISGNATHGILIHNSTAISGIRISGNSITGNGSLGIDLANNGVSANDAGDGDSGANGLQNYPVISSATLTTFTNITGTLNSNASSSFRIEFFESPGADSSGFGEGQNFIGAINVTTNGSGNASINTALPSIVPVGHVITATAINSIGNTSEFSSAITVTSTDTDGDGMPDAFETTYGLSTSVADANVDSDGDGMTNAQEFRARTDPSNSASLLRLGAPAFAGSDAIVPLPSVLGVTYRIDYADDLLPANNWRMLIDQLPGTGGAIIINDPGASALPRRFYRATVEP